MARPVKFSTTPRARAESLADRLARARSYLNSTRPSKPKKGGPGGS